MSLSVFYCCMSQGVGVGGLLWISRDRDDQMGAKIKKKSLGPQTNPPKIPGPKLNPHKFHAKFLRHKNFQKTSNYLA